MSYQPNPFVNPNKRDIELPGGCKDLNEVLEKGSTVLPKTVSLRRHEGTIWSLKDMLYEFDKETPDETLAIRHLNSGALLILSRAEGSYCFPIAFETATIPEFKACLR